MTGEPLPDYGVIRRTLRAVNEEFDAVEGLRCGEPTCEGRLRTDGDRLVCDRCGRPVPERPGPTNP